MTSGAVSGKRIGVGVWGIGSHARRTLLPAISVLRELCLISIGSRSIPTVQTEAKRYRCHAVTSLKELIEIDSIDVIFVATPIGCHAADVALAYEAGKHVWCEKAFTQNLDDAIRLVKISREKDLALCVSCAPLYHPVYNSLMSMITDSTLGRIRSIFAHFGFPHTEGHSKYNPHIGGGALLDIGFYPLVLGAALLGGRPAIHSVIIEKDSGFKVDTGGTSLLRSPSGTHLIARWGYGQDYINEISVFGETGVLKVAPAFSKPDHLNLKMTIQRQNQVEEVAIPTVNQFALMLQSFARTINEKIIRESYRKKAIDHQELINQVKNFS